MNASSQDCQNPDSIFGRKSWDQAGNETLYQFQIKDAVKAARIEATKTYSQYVEEPKTSQRRGRFDLELVLSIGNNCLNWGGTFW